MSYLYDAVKAKLRATGFDSLTQSEKFDWHGDVYGRRRARLGVSKDERTSPADPKGEWFDQERADYAEAHYRNSHTNAAAVDLNVVRESRKAGNEWARQHGYADFDDYKAREGLDDVDACCNVACSLIAAAVLRNRDAFGEPKAIGREEALRALGVRAREYTPEELRRGRVALGLEEEQEPPAVAAE